MNRSKLTRWARVPLFVVLVISAAGALTFGADSYSTVSLVINGFLWLTLQIAGLQHREPGRPDNQQAAR